MARSVSISAVSHHARPRSPDEFVKDEAAQMAICRQSRSTSWVDLVL
jgi:hypothetical protein